MRETMQGTKNIICTINRLLDLLDVGLSLANSFQIEFLLAGSVELSVGQRERGKNKKNEFF